MYAFWSAWICVDMLLLFDIIFSDVVNLSNEAKPSLQCIFKQEMMNKKQYYNICMFIIQPLKSHQVYAVLK